MPSEGNPFFALRVPIYLLEEFKACARRRGIEPTQLLRLCMAEFVRVDLEAAAEISAAVGLLPERGDLQRREDS